MHQIQIQHEDMGIEIVNYRITEVMKVETDIIGQTSDNVSRDLQNWHYCFYQ